MHDTVCYPTTRYQEQGYSEENACRCSWYVLSCGVEDGGIGTKDVDTKLVSTTIANGTSEVKTILGFV